MVSSVRKNFNFRCQSGAHTDRGVPHLLRPDAAAFNSVDDKGKLALEASIARLLATHDRGGVGGLVVPAEYLEIVLEKR